VHHNNVSNIVFHPKEDIMISNSEDRTIRVFDMSSSKRQPLFVHKRDTDKFWILSVHPKLNIFAAGTFCLFVIYCFMLLLLLLLLLFV
jgi:coatomer protein complex subunit alpha (xenin)